MTRCRCGAPALYSALLSPPPARPVLALVQGVLCYRCALAVCEGANNPTLKPGEQMKLLDRAAVPDMPDYREQEGHPAMAKYNRPNTARYEAKQPSAKGLRGCKGVVQTGNVWRPCCLPRKHDGPCEARA